MIAGTYQHFKIVKNIRPNDGRKTDTYLVFKEAATVLGQIQWHAPWRRYVLVPAANTIWDAQCLADIHACLKKLMAARLQSGD